MEIALIHNNQLILGPMPFNMRMINSELSDLELSDTVGPQSYNNLPIHFSDGVTHLVAIEKIIPQVDFKYYNLGNFSWEIVEINNEPQQVNFIYPVIEKTVEDVRNERKKEAALIRKQKENTEITLTINNISINVNTSREERQLLTSKLSSSSGNCNYKFNNVWVEVSSQDIQYVLNEIDIVVQEAYDWEYSKNLELDACQTVEEVYSIIITPVDPFI